MKNKRLIPIRKKLDKIDNNLLFLFKKRTLLVDQVLKTKKYKNEIVDKKRIKLILKNIRKKSLKLKIDTIVTKRIWTSIIRAYINYEYRNFNK